jgi:uncharacterized protein YecA (UPF0149 family)
MSPNGGAPQNGTTTVGSVNGASGAQSIGQPALPRAMAALSGPGEQKSALGSTRRVGRNDPCPCGSGKKYKFCHGG